MAEALGDAAGIKGVDAVVTQMQVRVAIRGAGPGFSVGNDGSRGI
jgi:hypothetical protein